LQTQKIPLEKTQQKATVFLDEKRLNVFLINKLN
jgi:hypothetical protein